MKTNNLIAQKIGAKSEWLGLTQCASFILLGCALYVVNVDAASVAISDTPMAIKNTVKSNIMFTVDNSAGTDVDVLLTTFNSMYYEWGGATAASAVVAPSNDPTSLNGNFYLLPSWYRENNGLGTSLEKQMLEGDLGSPDANHWRVRNSNYNAQYYNPFKVYQPWPGTNTSGAVFGNANPARAYISPPYWGSASNSVTFDLTRELSSGATSNNSVYKGGVAQSWSIPQAHTFLSTATPPTDISSTGGRYYNSTWYPAAYYLWVEKLNFVSAITVTAGGSGYPSSFNFNVPAGGGGSGATATGTAVGGVLTAVTLTAPGTGYTTPFTITIPGGNGNATADVSVGGNGVMDVGEGVRYEIKDPAVTCTPTDKSLDASGKYLTKIPGCGSDGSSAGVPACASGTLSPYTGCNPATYPNGNTYAAEIQNFANWFQYYRTPLLTLQGALGKQLETLGGVNVGLIDLQSKINSTYTTPSAATWSGDTPHPLTDFFGTVQDMSVASNMTLLRSNLYAIEANLDDWRQPIHERLRLVYDYFRETTPVNGHNTPWPDGTAGAPIHYACQQNFNVLSTPGYLNENGGNASGFKNRYTNVTPAGISPSNYDNTTIFTGCGAAPCVPYADSFSNTLADWAAYFYNTNLRTDLTAGQVALTPAAHEDNPNLHITQYVMAPGSQPTLQSNGRTNAVTGVFEKLNPMTVDPWTINPSITWPQPAFVDQTTVDDLWHAAVNGRGKFVNDTDIYGGLKAVLNDIFGRVGASAAVAVSNANVTPGDNFSYASSYNSGNWTGDLQSYPIDLATGQASATMRWVPSAQGQLDNLVNTATRVIATYSGSAGIPFQWASLDAAHQALLNSPMSPPGLTDGANVLAFLRGERKNEGILYRTRGHILGDIVNAEPVILREPQFGYADAGYASYKAAYTKTNPRTKVVFQAANDGMLHTFDATSGAELWAYVPGLLFNSTLAPTYPSTSTLANLSFRTGFKHLYMVDGTPSAGDVDFGYVCSSSCATPPAFPSASPDWHALLVGGLNNGGYGYYALDVTVPDKATATTTTALTEAELAAKVKWEFPNNSTNATVKGNIGHSYGKPYITKTKAAGWVVLVTSGYNNGTNTGDSQGDGKGHLFVLNAKTGALIKDIPTTAGDTGTPSGLGQIVGYSDSAYQDNTAKFVYGGDLLGNVWRFDLTGATVASWKVDLLATLADASGTPQAITTTPALALSNGKPMVFVGTGQYLSDADVSNTQTQSMYGLIDEYDANNPSVAKTITPLRSSLDQQKIVALSGTSRAVAMQQSVSNPANRKGWYVDFTLSAGERVITDPAVVINNLAFTTNIPSSADPCKPGGSSWFYTLDYGTGGLAAGQTSAANFLGDSLASRPILVKLPNGTIKALVRQSDATTTTQDAPSGMSSGITKRVSWREIRQQQ